MNQIQIGKFISAKRKEQGLTKMQLAEKLGITDRAVSKWEKGKSIMLKRLENFGIQSGRTLDEVKSHSARYGKEFFR